MAYASASNVAGLCQNILGSEDNFTTSTCPTLSQVKYWLSSGCSVLEGRLAGAGYSVPVTSGTRAYDWLGDLNCLYAAARAEMSRTNITLAPGQRTRGQVFDEMFWKQLKELLQLDLTQVGVSRGSSGRLYVGGISVSDKDSWEDDTDRVPSRFRRGMFDYPGRQSPDSVSAS